MRATSQSQCLHDAVTRKTLMKQRLRTVLMPLVLPVILGFFYAIWFKITGLGIPCLFRLLTGLKCPGCGITHMCIDFLSGDFYGARRENVLLFYMLPALCLYWGINSMKYIITGRYLDSKFTNILLWCAIASLLIFGICRNIVGC